MTDDGSRSFDSSWTRNQTPPTPSAEMAPTLVPSGPHLQVFRRGVLQFSVGATATSITRCGESLHFWDGDLCPDPLSHADDAGRRLRREGRSREATRARRRGRALGLKAQPWSGFKCFRSAPPYGPVWRASRLLRRSLAQFARICCRLSISGHGL